jgi:hypothetical protein
MYEAEYYTEWGDIIPSHYGSGGGSTPFISGGYGWGGTGKTSQGNFQMHDGNGFGNGAYKYYHMYTFVCRRFNFWEIEITSK